MKCKIQILLLAILFISSIDILYGVPAKPGLVKITQADGSQITIRVNGDEHFKWRTTEAGDPILLQDDGNYYYATYTDTGAASATKHRVAIKGKMQSPPAPLTRSDMSSIAARAASQSRQSKIAKAGSIARSGFPSKGKIRSAVILVEYSDIKFSVYDPNTAFTNQLGKEGYSVSGAVGSARDYFTTNSRGQFDGQFDVYGPYTLKNERAYYGANKDNGDDVRADIMIKEAVEMADADGVDFSIYDYDNDGYIDNVFVYYAGHNEAEWASEDSVWPHKWVVFSQPKFDGKTLFDYACTSELRGKSGTTIAGIGTFCHEFSHVLGLADHYDTDDDENGNCPGLGYYDIMTSGSYNNNGNSPPLHNALELEMIGWTQPTVIDASQEITLEPIQNGTTYKILTETEGEYFLLENRDISSSVWDEHIAGEGLIITHVDRSDQYMRLWEWNAPNTDASHECFKFVVAGNCELRSGFNWEKVPYPYNSNNEWSITSAPAARSWGGNAIECNIKDIEVQSNGDVTFKAVHAINVELRVDSDTEKIFIGGEFKIHAVLSSELPGSSFSWDCSSTTASIEDLGKENGIYTISVTFTEAQEATFTATYTDKESKVYKGLVTINAEALQGARGYIKDLNAESGDKRIAGAQIMAYPVTRTATAAGAEFTRSATTAQSKTTTNGEGFYQLELPEGYYEVEVKATDYQTWFEIIEIENGVNQIDIELASNAYAIESVEIEAGQTTAEINWNPKDYTSFRIIIIKDDKTFQTINCDQSGYNVKGLNPDTEYRVVISAKIGSSYINLHSATFTTMSQLTTIPMIQLDSYEYSAGETLELKIHNSAINDSVTWYYDERQLYTDKVILSAGEHRIRALVVRGSDTYTANCYINVR